MRLVQGSGVVGRGEERRQELAPEDEFLSFSMGQIVCT